jgi:thiol-disulfide isomerase/thioredoxin
LVPCLSCLKLEFYTIIEFTFVTAKNLPHPDFVLENLTKRGGPVFLEYGGDACDGCVTMHPVITQLLDVEFGEKEMFYKTITFENYNVTFIYVNIHHTTDNLKNSKQVYEKDGGAGIPMFSVVTFGYDNGIIRPYYVTLYGTLDVYGCDTNEKRATYLTEILQESIEMYKQNKEGYNIH